MHKATLLLLVCALGACTGTGATTTTLAIGEGGDSPVAAVEELRSLLAAGDFEAASALTVPDQAALAALAEGATSGQVADAIEDDEVEIGANFWGGFAQGSGEVFTGDITVEDRGTTTEQGVEFSLVGVTPASGTERLIITRNVDGQHIDLFASFGAGLADRMITPVEILLSASNRDSGVILGALQDVVPSLLVAATDEALSPEVVQSVLQLVELITRVG
jgi:hypothetical protein